MRSAASLLPLLLAAAAAPAARAATLYSIPQSLAVLADDQNCTFPDDFSVLNFTGDFADDGHTALSFDFTFADDSTNVTTPCHFNATSKPIGDPERTARYACDSPLAQFIWQNGTLTLVEEVCPGEDGEADFETAGTIAITLLCDELAACGDGNPCRANSTNITSRFFSLNPKKPLEGPGGGPTVNPPASAPPGFLSGA